MKEKIFRAISFVAISVLLASFLLIFGVLYNYFNQRFRTELENSAAYIAQGVSHEGIRYFDGLDRDGSRITWIAADGSVLYDSYSEAGTMESHADRQEVRAAFETGSGSSARYSKTYGEQTYYYAVLLADGTVLRVANTQHSFFALVLNMIQPIAVIFLIAIVLCAVIGTKLSRQIMKPINAIDLEHPEKCEIYDELFPFLRKIRFQNRVIAEQLEQLQIKQQEFATITKNMSEGFLVVDRDAALLSYNDSILQMLHIAADAVAPGQNVLTMPADDAFHTAIALALAGEHDERHLDSGPRHYLMMANPVFNNGDVAGAVLVVLDHTEKENGDAMRREFTANVSHELKTPLTAISGTAEILMNGIVRSEDVQHFAENIYNEAQRLITLVEDIIKLSQLDENVVTLEKSWVDLHDLSQTVIERLSAAAQKRGVSLRLGGTEARVFGVERVLDEIIYNLCDNAIKYNHENGEVEITTGLENGRARFQIRDSGIGIPPAHQERVFERFYRVDKSHSKEIGGTGLGLSIVKHGVAFHSAALHLESEAGKGTTVTIDF